jgi:hypothetical protein
MTPIYLTASTLADFGPDRLAEHLLCRSREAPGHSFRPEGLATGLAAIASESDLRARIEFATEVAGVREPVPAELAALTAAYAAGTRPESELIEGWRDEVLRRVGASPYRLGSPTLQLPFPADMALEVLALAIAGRRKLAGEPVEPPLIETPCAPPEAPTFGAGPDIVIVGDPKDRALPDFLDTAAATLGERAGQVRWVWMHAPQIETPTAAARAIQRQHLLAGKDTARIGLIAEILRVQGMPYVPPLAAYAKDPQVEQVLRHLWILDACGVPRSVRPLLVVGRKLIGSGDLAQLVEQVDARS